MKRILVTLLAATAVALLASAASADRIVTFSGKTLVGKITLDEPDKVVIQTETEEVTVPRVTIRSIDKTSGEKTPAAKSPDPAEKAPAVERPQPIFAVEVDPKDLDKVRALARAAVVAGEWAKAGGYLEGITKLDLAALPVEKRLDTLALLTTCYLQCKDAAGAARTLTRRSALVTDAAEKKRVLAAAEMLKTSGTVSPLGKPLGRYDEALEASLAWKAQQCFAMAKQIAAKATDLNDRAKLEKAAIACQDKLAEADAYVTGFSAKHREEALAALVQNIMDNTRQFVEKGTETRKDLARTRLTSMASIANAKEWNAVAGPYLARRQAAEDAMKGLKDFTAKFEIGALYDATEAEKLLVDLEDLAYYPSDAPRTGPRVWTGTTYGRVRIELRRFGP